VDPHLRLGAELERQTALADHHAAPPGSSASGGKNLHRQVRSAIDTYQSSSFDVFFFRGLTDESEILKFLQHGTLVGLLPVPHPILIRKYQANHGTTSWFRTYMWGVIYLR
jgi:Dyggve-Melchior-Clausen syndrome protein